MSYSAAKLAIVMLLRSRCKHMFLQMHSMNDPNQSYTFAGVLFPHNTPYPIKSPQIDVDMVTGFVFK